MKFTVLRETPDNSGQYVATGQEIDTAAADAVEQVLDTGATEGSRFALVPYDPIRRTPAVAAVAASVVAEAVADAPPVPGVAELIAPATPPAQTDPVADPAAAHPAS